ncbi:cytochrome b [Rhodanobacter ginsengiterrae]|uniref:cytochrome b n=1 Tax=Rhodanobacter ginsengiterrae TaxID=2008451 RepID=UPI003CEDDF07
MASFEPSSRYAASSRWMHWTIFALVLLAYVCINLFEQFAKGSSIRANVLAAHYTAGLAVLLLVLPRLLLRLRNGRPPIAPAPPRWIELLGNITHVALYLFLLIQPILGIITLQIGGKPVTLFGVTLLPSFVSLPDRVLSHQFEDIHGTIGTIFYYVIGLHILAAFWHHFGRRDNTLKRML